MCPKPLLALALLISVPTTTLLATCQVEDMHSPYSDSFDVYGSARSHIFLTPTRGRPSLPLREIARRPNPTSPSYRSKTTNFYQGDDSDDDYFLSSDTTYDVRQQLCFSPVKTKENQSPNGNKRALSIAERLGADIHDLRTRLQNSLNQALAATSAKESIALQKKDENSEYDVDNTDFGRAFPPLKTSSTQDSFLDQQSTITESKLLVEQGDETENSDDANEQQAEAVQKQTLPKPIFEKKKRTYKPRSHVQIPSDYNAVTIKAREGLTRSAFQAKRARNEAPLTPEKKVKRLKSQHTRKEAPHAFKPAFISPTKTSSYTRSQARFYREALQESAKQLNDWRATFLQGINVICKELKADKDANKTSSASRFNTLFLQYFSKNQSDFFNQAYVQDTHVFFWNDNMVDLELKDSTGQSNRTKLKKGNNFVMYQSKDKGKVDIAIDTNGNFALTKKATDEDIAPSESNWLHLTQGKAGKSTYSPTELEKGTTVGSIAELFLNKKINIVFAGPRDIHCALHHLMNRFKKKDEPSVHSIPKSYTKERPLANKEVLRRKTAKQ